MDFFESSELLNEKTKVIASVNLQIKLLRRCSNERDSEIQTSFKKQMFNTMKLFAMNAIIVCRSFIIIIKEYMLHAFVRAHVRVFSFLSSFIVNSFVFGFGKKIGNLHRIALYWQNAFHFQLFR